MFPFCAHPWGPVTKTHLRCVKQGQCDRVKVRGEQVKGRQTIIEADSRLCAVIEVAASSGLSAVIRVSHTAQTSSR